MGGSSVAGILSLAFLPPNIGSTLCYLFALIPILYLAIGSTAPAAIAQVIDGIKNRDDPDRATDADRVARHEAAHFMCGYMCGLPIVDYKLLDDGVPCVEFSAGAGSRFSKEEVAGLSITAMSGLVAEAMKFGDVRGAENDLQELQIGLEILNFPTTIFVTPDGMIVEQAGVLDADGLRMKVDELLERS